MTIGQVIASRPFERHRVDEVVDETTTHMGCFQSQFATPHNPSSLNDRKNTPQYLGGYELHEEIGRGGMGTVYRASQVSLNRQVALKMILSGKFSSELEIRRFHIEAQAAAQLDHPAIIPIFEIQEHDGLHFFTMAYIDGQPLSARLKEGPLSPRDAAVLMLIVATGIQYAHEHGVVHRDLKPGNILIDATGHPRISDFGLAKRISVDSATTSRGDILGTPSYMPPEQAQGTIDQIGPLSDVYSLGAVLYATLTGSPPFQSASPVETLRHVVEHDPISPRKFNPEIPRDLETIALKCMEKVPSNRYSSAKAVAEDLDRFLERRPIAARPVSRIEHLLRWAHRRYDISLLVLALFLLVGIGIATISVLLQQHSHAAFLARIEGLVRQIETAEFAELPRLIPDLSRFANSSAIDQELLLRSRCARSPEARIRLGLAQCLIRKQLDAETFRSWLNLSLEDLSAIARITPPISNQVQGLTRAELLEQPSTGPAAEARRLRAFCLFASHYSSRRPGHSSPLEEESDEHLSAETVALAMRIDWESLCKTALQLLYENPAEFKAALELLRPAAIFLRSSLKACITSESLPVVQRNLAISLLGELSSDVSREIADLACLVDVSTFNLVTRHLERTEREVVSHLTKILQNVPEVLEASGEHLSDESRVALANSICRRKAELGHRRAMAAGWLYRLGHSDLVWPWLKLTSDSTLRYAILDRIRVLGVSAQPIVRKLEDYVGVSRGAVPSLNSGSSDEQLLYLPSWSTPEATSEIQIVILLSGEMADRDVLTADERERIRRVLTQLFRNHPHAGIHSSCEWSMRKLGAASLIEEVQRELLSTAASEERDWLVTRHGTTMALFHGPLRYQAGTDWTDPERVANTVIDPVTTKITNTDREPSLMREISRDFAIGTKEVSLREFLHFDPQFHERINQFSSSTLDHPVNNLNWYLAAEYCNWLSEAEGLDPTEWCFIPNEEGRYAEGMTLAANYLHRTGYRMPTEVEWEYACRGGTTTPRFFGHCRELLPQYAWYRGNSRERALIVPGSLKPNDAGLFDVFGNVIEWCIDPYAGRPTRQDGIIPDIERGLTADAEAWRVLRGGHLYAEENELRATDLWTFRPLVTNGHYGLRLARTVKVHVPNVSGPSGQPSQ